jgi:hypothetical protein
MKSSIVINGEIFETKKALEKRVQRILHGAAPGHTLDHESSRFMLALLQRHRGAAQKIGVGVQTVRTVLVPPWNTIGFLLVRVDGSTTDFSYKACITDVSPEQELQSACRNTVSGDIIAFKTAAFQGRTHVLCPILGTLVSLEDVDVDHVAPWTFKALIESFIVAYGKTPEIAPGGDNDVLTCFADEDAARAFLAWHRLYSRLRIVSRDANRGVLRRTR